jgi:hypothetical protein
MTEDYLVWLLAGIAASQEILDAIYRRTPDVPRPFINGLKSVYKYLKASPLLRRIMRATSRARKEAREIIAGIRGAS